jgi:hypothetical protein
MKIELDLSKSYSNYEWDNKNELKDFIDNYMLRTLWKLYDRNEDKNFLTDEEQNKLYDILDMFREYKVKEETDM